MAEVQALDGVRLQDAVLRLGEFEPATYSEQHHFKLYVEVDGQRSDRPILHGLASAGRASQHIPGWIDGHYGGVTYFDGERQVLGEAGLERPIMAEIGSVLRSGGWLGLAYETLGEDTGLLRETRRLLDRDAPPIVTPVGGLLHAAGCGLHIRNWYISEGWREGSRKLQGYRPAHEESRRKHARETAEALRSFLDRSAGADELGDARGRAAALLAEIGDVTG